MIRVGCLLFLLLISCVAGAAAEFKISSTEPVVVSAPAKWELTKAKPPRPAPFETWRLSPPDGRNAACLISLLGKDREQFTDPEFLKMLLKMDSQPYVSAEKELSNINIKDLKVAGGLAVYVNFVDPDLAGKPVKKGDYKTATPIIVTIGSKYLVKITILCDELNGLDYREAMKIVESIKEKIPEA
ncbi:MAG TPA: hypothetical protein VK850_13580 [Candidatus Binatia bacterium]|nr:hypothetical protein [Candidatus Binatia bacterium]